MKRMALGLLLVGGVAVGCSSSNSTTTPGTGGSNAGTAGTSGTGGTSAGGAGGTSTGGTGGGSSGFMAIEPCSSESDYMTGTTVSFGGAVGFAYAPNCLKVSSGSTVTFSGDFSLHPLEPSATRGNTTSNPITAVSGLPDGGTAKAFTFPTPGYYAYFCSFHGSSDTGGGMAGVIWVQ